MAQEGAAFARSHLAHELEYMLAAATTWCACHPDKRAAWPKHLVATAEYAAFVHQRSLYEFFCDSGGAFDARKLVGQHVAFGSELYDRWETHLNTAVMHLWRRWKSPAPIIAGAHLKDQVAAFASDIVRLWSELEHSTSVEIADELRVSRDRAVGLAAQAATGMGAPQLDWTADDPFASWGRRKWWPVGES